MIFPIHTPNVAMSLAILVSWGTGCSCVAGNIYSRYFIKTSVSPMTVQFWTRFFIVILGIVFFPNIEFWKVSWLLFIPSIVIGYVCGVLVVRFELWNERKHYDALNANSKNTAKAGILEKDIGEIESFQLGLCPVPQKISDWKDRSLSYIYEIKNKHESYSPTTLVGIAILEEIIFRGYLLSFCFLLPPDLTYFAIALLIVIFGAKHMHTRSREFFAKSFLGLITTLETLFLGNIIAAAVTHSYLNYYVYRQRKKMGLQ